MTIENIKAIRITSEERKAIQNALITLTELTTLFSRIIEERTGTQNNPLNYSLSDIYELLECDDAYTIL